MRQLRFWWAFCTALAVLWGGISPAVAASVAAARAPQTRCCCCPLGVACQCHLSPTTPAPVIPAVLASAPVALVSLPVVLAPPVVSVVAPPLRARALPLAPTSLARAPDIGRAPPVTP